MQINMRKKSGAQKGSNTRCSGKVSKDYVTVVGARSMAISGKRQEVDSVTPRPTGNVRSVFSIKYCHLPTDLFVAPVFVSHS